MFGSFNEEALAAYAEKVRGKKVHAVQGTEAADNWGVGEHDHSFLDSGESLESHDYTACVRKEGQL